MQFISANLKHIPLWRLIIAALFLLGLSFDTYDGFLEFGAQPSLQEIIYERLETLGLSFYFIFLLLIVDLGMKDRRRNPAGMVRDSFIRQLGYMSFLCSLFALSYVAFSLLSMLIRAGSLNFSDTWNTVRFYGPQGVPPSLAMGIILLLFILRFIFITVVVFTVNSRCRKLPLGYVGGFLVFILDAIVQYHFWLETPVGIFPFEHLSLRFALGLTNNLPLDVVISVLYWFLLIVVVGMVYYILNKHHKPQNTALDERG